MLIGLAIACGYILQTMGLAYTTASKAGFLTGLYVVLVSVMESFLCKCLPRYNMILGVCLATVRAEVMLTPGNYRGINKIGENAE